MKSALYHFPTSPFSRRARLCLAKKKVDVELRDARANDAYAKEARALSALNTFPVFVHEVSGSPRVIGDSTALSRWLDRAFVENPIWPVEPTPAEAAYEVAALVDSILNTLIDAGTRYYALSKAAEWESVRSARVARVQAMFARLVEIVQRGPHLAGHEWSAADIWLTTLVLWMEGLPGRAATYPPAAQLVSLGYQLPKELSDWANAHRHRGDVLALDQT